MADDFTAQLVAELTHDEGLRLKPYLDTEGLLTIGIGRNLADVGITKEEAHYLCANDIDTAEWLLDKYVPWWRQLDEDRQRVLANMAFNLGPRPEQIGKREGLLGFHRFLFHLQNREWDKAADAMLESKWSKQVGPRAERLAARVRGTKVA